MPIIDTPIRTITCDGPGCLRTTTFDQKDKTVLDKPENSWLKTSRGVQSADGRNFTYCSDICEVKGAETGRHNVQEPPKIVTEANPAVIAAAAQAAANARRADAAIRDGQPTKVQLTD